MAYIPQLNYIFDKTALGVSSYFRIEQELVYTSNEGPIKIREIIWIDTNDKVWIRSQIVGGSIQAGSQAVNSNGAIVFQKTYEPSSVLSDLFFYASSGEKLGKFMGQFLGENINAQVAKIARLDGNLAWLVESKNKSSAVWIEQDQFLIRKLRFQNQDEIKIQSYAQFGQPQAFPQKRTYSWSGQKIEVQTKRVIKMSAPVFLNQIKGFTQIAMDSDLDSSVQQFYSRFR